MKDLPHHFGTDASLDAAQVEQIGTWLVQNADRRHAGAAAPQDRITLTRWFVREHREVPRAAWKRASVGSASNCAACHAGANQGDFDEHSIRIPR